MQDWNMLYHLIARSLTSTDELKLRFEEITKELKIKGKIGNFWEDLVQQIWRTCLDDFAQDLAPQIHHKLALTSSQRLNSKITRKWLQKWQKG